MERQRLLCLGQYKDPPLSAWILAFKHGHRADLAEPLGALLAQRVLTRWGKSEGGLGPGVLVPVPLHPARRVERGYDQAWELAVVLGRHLGWPVEAALRRVRSSAPQGSWRALERGKNVEQAFAPVPQRAAGLEGRDLWLVDDVSTSGETLRCCRKALGSHSVRGALVLARAGLAPGPTG